MALVKIVYASMTGNTEEIADIVGNKFEELGHTVEVDECTTVDAADFEMLMLRLLHHTHTEMVNCQMKSLIFTKILQMLI